MFKVFDLFAGAGGFGLGFKMSGYELTLSLEIDKWAVETLLVNHPRTLLLQEDIRKYNNLSEIKASAFGAPDVIIGGPPCQGFSFASSKSDPNDPRNTLFTEFAKWVDFFQPKAFVMENVVGLLSRTNANNEKVIDIIRERFEQVNYSIEIWKLNAAEYGVPQLRNRIFIVGNQLGKTIGKPSPTHFLPGTKKISKNLKPAVTVWKAISDLPQIIAGEGEEIMHYKNKPRTSFQKWARTNCSLVFNHEAMKHTKRLIERYRQIQSGTLFDDLPEDLKVLKRNGQGEFSLTKFQSNYRHIKPDKVSYTIPASFYSNFIHPTIPRNITSREAARIQSFPDTYIFRGKRTQISSNLLKKIGKEDLDHLSQYNQIGNAVPPLLAKAIADKIQLFLKENY
jgi:DNA (cytosine-5)-methyltransferase 1